LWLPVVAALMVSILPTFSGKLVSRVMARAWALLLVATGAIALFMTSQGVWRGLVVLALGYLSIMPLSYWRHSVLLRRS
jgi:phosphatidylserine synthase